MFMGAGRSEKIIGEFIQGRDDEIIVATKMGRATSDWNDSYDEISKAAELSCKRLGVDSLDLVQLHCIPEQTLKGLKAFENLEENYSYFPFPDHQHQYRPFVSLS